MFKTSDNKLDFTISQQQILRAIENGGPQSHGDQVQELAARHAQNYGQFKFELSQGFSLLFYGYGSKQDLMLDFAHKTSQGR